MEAELLPLKEVISSQMVKRLAENGLSMSTLKNTYKLGKYKSIKVLLAEDDGEGRVKITKQEKIIKNVCNYLKAAVQSAETGPAA